MLENILFFYFEQFFQFFFFHFLFTQIDQEWQRTFLITPETLNDKELWMNLDDKEAKVAIRIGELLAQPDSHKRESVSCLASQFKLIQLCERHINSSLTDLKELLGCPILLFNPERIKDFREDDQKESICLTLFYSINWFRELINAFSWLSDDIIVTSNFFFQINFFLKSFKKRKNYFKN